VVRPSYRELMLVESVNEGAMGADLKQGKADADGRMASRRLNFSADEFLAATSGVRSPRRTATTWLYAPRAVDFVLPTRTALPP